MNAPAVNPQLLRLSALIDLQQRAGQARGAELGYLMVNDTMQVVPYQQAALWRDGRVSAVSGVAAPEAGGPFPRWLQDVLARAVKLPADDAAVLTVDPEAVGLTPSAWTEWFPAHAVLLRLPDPRGGLSGAMLLGRADPFHPGETQLLAAIAGTYGLAMAAADLPRRRVGHRTLRHWLQGAAVLAVVAASFAPVRSSVLAPAEIVAAAPSPIRAPFDGVVDAVHVTPNQPVHKGDNLLSFETTERRAKAEVASKALEIARAEFTEASQQAFNDPQAKARLALLQAKVDQARLEADYNREMLARAEVAAPSDGVAVFDDAHQWIGRPVALGERIMVLAPPSSTRLDIAVPVADVVTFEQRAEVVFFPNIAPDHPAHGSLASVGYAANVSPDGVLSYTARAALDGDGLRLGLKGTAKIYGPRRPFILWVLRRPLAVAREWLSL